MLTYEIVGLSRYDFVSNSGEHLMGYKIYCTQEDPSDTRLQGVTTTDFSISDSRLGRYMPTLGDRLFISWQDKKNRRVESIMPVD